MLPARLHALFRYRPQLRRHVELLLPCRAAHLTRTTRSQYHELGRAGRDALTRTQIDNKAGDLASRQCGVVRHRCKLIWIGEQIFKVPSPARGIVAMPEFAGARPVQDALDASTQPHCRFGLGAPDRAENFHHQVSLHVGNGQLSD